MQLIRSTVWLGWCLLGVRLFAQTPPAAPTLEPLTGAKRASLYLHDAFWSPGVAVNAVMIGVTGLAAGEPREWGQGAAGFARRAGSAFGRNAIYESYRSAGSAALRHEVRYVPLRNRSVWTRIANAVTRDFVTYNAAGARVPNIAAIGAAIGSEYTTNLWLPDRFRSTPRTFARAGYVVAFDGAGALFQEFSPELKLLNPFRKK